MGLGATVELYGRPRFMGGARYIHVSNADTTDVNDGFNGALLYAGIMPPF